MGTGYKEYSLQVRHEFKHVPWDRYVSGRGAVLSTFADNAALFGHPVTRRLFDAQARGNLAWELAWLRGSATTDPLLGVR